MNSLLLVFGFPGSSQEVSARHCANLLGHCTDVWRAQVMSLSHVHFSSLLWSLRRLPQHWKWSFDQMSSEDPRIDMCVSSWCQCLTSCVLAVRSENHALHVCFQPATCMSAYQLLNTSEHSYFPVFFLCSSLSVWISELSTLYSIAMHFTFYRSKRLKQLEAWKDPVCFLRGQWGWDSCM